MGKIAGLVGDTDGNLHTLVDSEADAPQVIYLGAGRLLGYYVNELFSSHIWVFKDDTTEMFSLPIDLVVDGKFIPIGGVAGIEFLTSLIVDSDNAMTSGKMMVVYQPYQEN